MQDPATIPGSITGEGRRSSAPPTSSRSLRPACRRPRRGGPSGSPGTSATRPPAAAPPRCAPPAAGSSRPASPPAPPPPPPRPRPAQPPAVVPVHPLAHHRLGLLRRQRRLPGAGVATLGRPLGQQLLGRPHRG